MRWKIALPFDGLPLALSPILEQSLKQLKAECFHLSAPSFISPTYESTPRCGMECYSPLTFRYVISDMIRRGGFRDPAAVMSSAFSRLPPVFSKWLETAQALADHRPVWRVKVSVPYTPTVDDDIFQRTLLSGLLALRLILVPLEELNSIFIKDECFPDDVNKNRSVLYKLNSTGNYFFDNLDVNMKRKPDGVIRRIEVSFLLHDRSLLKSHCPIIVGFHLNGTPETFFMNQDWLHSVESFQQPTPCPVMVPSSTFPVGSSRRNRWLEGESCKESEEDYTIRFKIHQSASVNPKPPSGKQ